MTKTFILKGLDCPHCSAEIERDVGALDGITSSSVNLIKQTLTISLDNSYKGNIFNDIAGVVHNHEPDVTVTEKGDVHDKEEDSDKKDIIRIGIGAAVYAIGLALPYMIKLPLYAELAILIAAYIILGGNVVLQAVKNILKGRVFDENFLMTVSSVGAFIIGSYHEAVAVMLFYQIGEFFQDAAVRRSRKSISDLMDIRPDYANAERNGHIKTVSPEDVKIGEKIIVKPGEKIPLDGIVTEGESMLDTRALTGESVPRTVRAGDEVLSGCINQSGVLTIEVTKEFSESTASKIIDLVENAAGRKAPTENFITVFSRYYTPVVVILAVLLAVIPPLMFGFAWSEWIRRGFVFLVISCPCALVISIPLTFFGGIGAASRKGVLVKGGNYLEALNKVDTVVFDKTGTLTKGVFNVNKIIPSEGFSEEQVIEYAAKAESFSNHPIAVSIKNAYENETDTSALENYREIAGLGVSVEENGRNIIAGNDKAMEHSGIEFTLCKESGTKVYIAYDGKFAGCIVISDEIKSGGRTLISELNKIGIKKAVMLTGDNRDTAKAVADELGISEYFAELLPEDKVAALENISKNNDGGKIAFVGDGINDAPVLARADIGVAMGGVGSDAAVEAADVVLITDEPSGIIDALKIARATKRIVVQNIVFALGIKGIFLILGALGIAGMWVAVFGDVGVMIIAVLNSMRILKKD